MSSHSITPPEKLSEHLLESLHLPVFVVESNHCVRWLNEAAWTFIGKGVELAVGQPFGAVLGVDQATANRVLPPAGESYNADWVEFMAKRAGSTGRTFKIRRIMVPDSDTGVLALLTVEGAAWWEDPDMGLLTGSRFLIPIPTGEL